MVDTGFTFLHAADIHLDSPLCNLVFQEHDAAVIRGAVRRAFDNLIQLALDRQVAFVLLAGDIYDGPWKDYHTGIYFINHMHRLRRAGIRVFMVSGNHDAASRITSALRLPDNVVQFPTSRPDTVLIDELRVAIHGRGYSSSAVTDNLALEYPGPDPAMFNIGLLHTSLNGRAGHEPYAPCTVEELVSREYDYWALGHVHQQEIVSEDPWIVFPGNIQGRHIREAGPRGVMVVTVENGVVREVEHEILDVVRWSLCRLDLSGCATVDEVLDRVRHDLAGAVDQSGGRAVAVRMELTGTPACHHVLHRNRDHLISEILALATDLGEVWLEKIRLRTSAAGELADSAAGEGGLLDLDRLMDGIASPLDLAPELEKLQSKLPTELTGGDPVLPGDPEAARSLVVEARDMLLARILEQKGSR